MYRARAFAALIAITVVVLAPVPTHSLEAGDTLIYQLDLSMKMSGVRVIEDVDMRVSGTVKIAVMDITEDYITIRIEPNLNVEGLPPEYSDVADEINQVQVITVPTSGMLGPLNEEVGIGLSDMLSILQEQLQALGFNETKVEVSEVAYNGIPAIKLKIDLKAMNYLGTGINLEMHGVSYFDMATLALLHDEATLKSDTYATRFEMSYKIELMNPDVLQQSLEWYEVEVVGGNEVSIAFAASGLSVSEFEVTDNGVTFRVSGKGLGAIIIAVERGDPEPEVYVDGRPVSKYKIVTAADGTTYYKVPIKFSQHEVEAVFSEPVIRAVPIEPSLPSEGGGAGSLLSGPYMTLVIALVIIAVAGVATAAAIKRARRKGPEATPPPVPETPPQPPPPPPAST